MNSIQMFEGQEVKIKTDKGITAINLVHVAKCCGLTQIKKGVEYVRWKDRGIADKLKNILSHDCEKDVKDEINYILDEIDNANDRSSIYMSSWLSKRLAMECQSEKAMKFKNFLVTLDEARENGQLINTGNEVSNMVGQVLNQIIPTLTEQLALQVAPVVLEAKTQVNNMTNLIHDQSVIYDDDREELKSLIGFRAVNTKRLSDLLKHKLSKKADRPITANTTYYKNAKKKIFKEFNVIKWEDIPANKYNAVYAYIDEIDISC